MVYVSIAKQHGQKSAQNNETLYLDYITEMGRLVTNPGSSDRIWVCWFRFFFVPTKGVK